MCVITSWKGSWSESASRCVPAVSDASTAGRVLCQPMGVWCQEACFGMALPSLLGGDFVFVNVSSLPPDSHEVRVCMCVCGGGDR